MEHRDDADFSQEDDAPFYEQPDAIDKMGLVGALSNLTLFSDDMYMGVQAHNLNLVDQFIMDLEYKVLRELHETETTPAATHFLLAQSQMWIFAAYELLRTWQQRSREIIKWSDNGGLEQKLASLKEKDDGYLHFGREMRISQIESMIADPDQVPRLQAQLKHLHIPFSRLEYVRVSIAKHEVSGKAKAAALMPGYGRINSRCGSLDFELENGSYSMGYINRRNIADSIRHLDFSKVPPTDQDLKDFDAYMSGKGFEQATKLDSNDGSSGVITPTIIEAFALPSKFQMLF